MRPHVLSYMPDGFVQLATLATLVPPLTDMDFHVFLQQVTSQKLLVAKRALKGLVTCMERKITRLFVDQQKVLISHILMKLNQEDYKNGVYSDAVSHN